MANVVPLFEPRPQPFAGCVALVGAGPGDPGLMTRKAYAAVTTADILFYDELVSAEILAEVPGSVQRVYVGKPHGTGSHKITQDEIIALLIEAARTHGRVVRLKGGDPLIFGRGGEEAEALRAHGIAVEIVPGITAAQGAASAAQIPLSHRDHSAQIAFVTAVRRDGSLADIAGLAGKGKTLVVYMGVAQAAALAAALRADSLPATLPVAIVENANRPNERRFVTTVEALAATVSDNAVHSPALFIVGDVAGTGVASAPPVAGDAQRAFHWAHFAHG
jgi:uroporphyrin-III C-methyltransferase